MKLGGTRDHLISYTVSNGFYDLDYLEALFDNDLDAIDKFEQAAMDDGFGPLALCTTVANYNSMGVNCRKWLKFISCIELTGINFQPVNITLKMENFRWWR